jgi:hypothetical protein
MNNPIISRRAYFFITPFALAGTLAFILTAHRSHAAPATAPAGDDATFSNETVKGAYAFNTSFGEIIPPAPQQPIPTAAAGRIVFDGEGNCQVLSILNANAQTTQVTSSSCTYSVDATGVGVSEATFPGAPFPGAVKVQFVIDDAGRELRFVVDNFIVGAFTARRQH